MYLFGSWAAGPQRVKSNKQTAGVCQLSGIATIQLGSSLQGPIIFLETLKVSNKKRLEVGDTTVQFTLFLGKFFLDDWSFFSCLSHLSSCPQIAQLYVFILLERLKQNPAPILTLGSSFLGRLYLCQGKFFGNRKSIIFQKNFF